MAKNSQFTLASSVETYCFDNALDADRIVSAVISRQGQLQLDQDKQTYGGTSCGKKDVKVSFTDKKTYIGKRDTVLDFAAWNDMQVKAEDKFGVCEFSSVPKAFIDWLNKFSMASKPEEKPVNA
jgi:hypothetical protein